METSIHLSKLSDTELLTALCSQDQDEGLYNNFMQRFWIDLEKECTNICLKRKIDSQVGQQIVQETFERVRKYKSFKTDAIKLPDGRKAILVYLFRIANRLFNNHYARQGKLEIVHKTYFEDIAADIKVNIDAKDLKSKKELSIALLKKLNHNEHFGKSKVRIPTYD